MLLTNLANWDTTHHPPLTEPAAEEQIMRNALVPLKAIAERLNFNLTQERSSKPWRREVLGGVM